MHVEDCCSPEALKPEERATGWKTSTVGAARAQGTAAQDLRAQANITHNSHGLQSRRPADTLAPGPNTETSRDL